MLKKEKLLEDFLSIAKNSFVILVLMIFFLSVLLSTSQWNFELEISSVAGAILPSVDEFSFFFGLSAVGQNSTCSVAQCTWTCNGKIFWRNMHNSDCSLNI